MKKLNKILFLVPFVALTSCGGGKGKEIKVEEAYEVFAKIAEVRTADDFKAPEAATITIKIDNKEKINTTTSKGTHSFAEEVKIEQVIAYDLKNQSLHFKANEYGEATEDGETTQNDKIFELFAYKKGSEYVVASIMGEEKVYQILPIEGNEETIDGLIAEYSTIAMNIICGGSPDTVLELCDAEELFDENATYKYFTKGDGNLSVDYSYSPEIEEDGVKVKYDLHYTSTIDNYLLMSGNFKEVAKGTSESMNGDVTLNGSFKTELSCKFTKPNLNDFTKASVE